MRQTEVYENCKLNDRNKNKRQERRCVSTSAMMTKDRDNRNRIDNLEVVVSRFDHILHAGRFSDQHAGAVVLFQYRVERVDLIVDFIACDFILPN